MKQAIQEQCVHVPDVLGESGINQIVSFVWVICLFISFLQKVKSKAYTIFFIFLLKTLTEAFHLFL